MARLLRAQTLALNAAQTGGPLSGRHAHEETRRVGHKRVAHEARAPHRTGRELQWRYPAGNNERAHPPPRCFLAVAELLRSRFPGDFECASCAMSCPYDYFGTEPPFERRMRCVGSRLVRLQRSQRRMTRSPDVKVQGELLRDQGSVQRDRPADLPR